MKHHPLYPPSGIKRVELCPASAKMCLKVPDYDITTEEALEGTLLHDKVAQHNIEGLNQEQSEVVNKCIQMLSQVAGEHKIRHEYTVRINDENGKELTFGSVDALIEKDNEIIIVDFKFGYNPVDSADENSQLAIYALGASREFKKDKVTCIIFQPRIKHSTSSYVYQGGDAFMAIREYLDEVIEKAESSQMVFNPCDTACRFCKAKAICPAIESKTMDVIKYSPESLVIDKMAYYMDVAYMVEGWADSIKKKVKELLESGVLIPNYSLQKCDGRTEIVDINGAYQELSEDLTADEFRACCKGSFSELVGIYAKKRGLKLYDAKKSLQERLGTLLKYSAPFNKIKKVK